MEEMYKGRWLPLNQSENTDTSIIDVIRVDLPNQIAITDTGMKINIRDLDLNYEKISAPMYSPEVKEELAGVLRGSEFKYSNNNSNNTKQPKNPIIENINFINVKTKPTQQNTEPENENFTEIEKFIKQAIYMSHKKNESSQIQVSIPIDFNFDLFKIVGACSSLSDASNSDILSAIFKFNPIKIEDVTKTIISELLSNS